MARPFWPATAEQVIAAVEAVAVNQLPISVTFAAEFSDLPENQAESALRLAIDLGLLSVKSNKYSIASPLCRFASTPNERQKASILRVVLESYKPFVIFRERLVATNLAATAAAQTKTILDLDSHREAIKDTLISLGTYSHALVTEGGGHYRPEDNPSEDILEILSQGSADAASAEAHIRQKLGEAAGSVLRDEVLVPLADALLRAKSGDARGSVVTGGNAVESYLNTLAGKLSVDLIGANGINAKLDRFDRAG